MSSTTLTPFAYVLVRLPQPYDFELSTERFRAFGVDRLASGTRRPAPRHRRAGGADRGGAGRRRGQAARRVDRGGGAPVARRCRSTSTPSTRWAEATSPRRLAAGCAASGRRSSPTRWRRSSPRSPRSRSRSTGLRHPRPADRAVRRAAARARLGVPDARTIARATRTSSSASASRAARRSTSSGSRAATSTSTRSQRCPTTRCARLVALRGLGEWTADWFLARHLARPHAWPAGDLGLRKAVAAFYGDVPDRP